MDNPNENIDKEFSEEKGNMQVVRKDTPLPLSSDNDGLDIDVGSGGKIVIGRLNVFAETYKKRHEKHYKDSSFHFWADVVLGLIILALAGSLIAIRFWHPSKNIFMDSSFVGEAVTVGELETFEVLYGNKNGEEIEGASISVRLPKNFHLASAEPSKLFDSFSNTFKLGDLSSGANGKITLKGVTLGATGGRESMSFIFGFKKNGQPLTVLNSLHYALEDSALETKLEMPEKIYQGTEFDGKLSVRNGGSADIADIELAVGGNWLMKENGNGKDGNIFIVEKLKAGEAKEIIFTASTEGEGKEEFTVSSSILSDGMRFEQARIAKTVDISVPEFKMAISPDKESMDADDEAVFHLAYENKEDAVLKDVKIKFSSLNKNFLLDSLSLSRANGFKSEAFTIILPEAGIGKKGEADIKVRFDRRSITTNDEISLAAQVTYKLGSESVAYPARSSSVKVVSDLDVSAAGYYYSPQGDQLGIGPLPPAVDIPTRYWIFLEADNIGNDLSDFTVSAQLPADVVWTGNKSLLAGSLHYGQVSRRVTWTVSGISKSEGSYQAQFEVEIIPTLKDLGRNPVLLSDITYTAFDEFCALPLKGKLTSVTTVLESDKLSAGKGKVVR